MNVSIPRTVWDRLIDRFVVGDGCWSWTGATSNGYGVIQVGRTRGTALVHRIVYAILVGPIPEGLTIDHQCHNRAVALGECQGGVTCVHRRCVNPGHLEPATIGDNFRRGVMRRRLTRRA